MKKFLKAFAALTLTTSLIACRSSDGGSGTNEPAEDDIVTIEYWQYVYESKVNIMDDLITEFEAENPNIRVVHKTFPYDDYEQKVAAAIAASAHSDEAPNIINIFYGWVPKYVKSGVLCELPESLVNDMEANFTPMVQINKIEGKYYTIPVAVRTSALYYNKTLLDAKGISVEDIPTDLIEWAELAGSLAEWNGDELLVAGTTWQPNGQYHSWLRPVLMNQFGAQPISADGKTANYNSPEALEAFKFFLSLTQDYKAGLKDFLTGDVAAFTAGKAYFHVDGSYRLSNLYNTELDFEWGVTDLPSYNGRKGSFGSFWTNGITALTAEDPAKYEACVKFLEFITSEEVMARWTKEVGEIGARKSFATNEEFLADPNLAPFIRALDYATSYFYVDETTDRQIILDAIDQVIINGMDPKQALDEANTKVQALLDDYWSD